MPRSLPEPDPYSSIRNGPLNKDTPRPEIDLKKPHCTETTGR